MHELVIVEGILDAVLPEVKKHNVKKVISIKLKIGELSGVIPECIDYYFDIASKGTLAEGAKIVVEKVPVSISCRDCGYNGEIPRRSYRCPECGSRDIHIESGREYFIDSVEAE